MSVLEDFRLIFRSVRQHFQRIEAQTGISGAQLWVLACIGGHPRIRVTELAQALSIHQSTASNLIERLERRQFVRRTRSSADQRIVQLSLTAAGKRLVATAPQPVEGILPDALQRLPATELASLKKQLGNLTKTMKHLDSRGKKTPLSDI